MQYLYLISIRKLKMNKAKLNLFPQAYSYTSVSNMNNLAAPFFQLLSLKIAYAF